MSPPHALYKCLPFRLFHPAPLRYATRTAVPPPFGLAITFETFAAPQKHRNGPGYALSRGPSHLFTPDSTKTDTTQPVLVLCPGCLKVLNQCADWIGHHAFAWKSDQPNWETICRRLEHGEPCTTVTPMWTLIPPTNENHRASGWREAISGWMQGNALKGENQQVAGPVQARPKAAGTHVYKHTGRHFSDPGACTWETCKAPSVFFTSHPVQKSLLSVPRAIPPSCLYPVCHSVLPENVRHHPRLWSWRRETWRNGRGGEMFQSCVWGNFFFCRNISACLESLRGKDLHNGFLNNRYRKSRSDLFN